MALGSIFLKCMPQALIYHSRANVFLKSCFRISRDILLSKNIFGMTIIYNTSCLEVAKSLPYDIVIQKLFLIKMTTSTDRTKWKLQRRLNSNLNLYKCCIPNCCNLMLDRTHSTPILHVFLPHKELCTCPLMIAWIRPAI